MPSHRCTGSPVCLGHPSHLTFVLGTLKVSSVAVVSCITSHCHRSSSLRALGRQKHCPSARCMRYHLREHACESCRALRSLTAWLRPCPGVQFRGEVRPWAASPPAPGTKERPGGGPRGAPPLQFPRRGRRALLHTLLCPWRVTCFFSFSFFCFLFLFFVLFCFVSPTLSR